MKKLLFPFILCCFSIISNGQNNFSIKAGANINYIPMRELSHYLEAGFTETDIDKILPGLLLELSVDVSGKSNLFLTFERFVSQGNFKYEYSGHMREWKFTTHVISIGYELLFPSNDSRFNPILGFGYSFSILNTEKTSINSVEEYGSTTLSNTENNSGIFFRTGAQYKVSEEYTICTEIKYRYTGDINTGGTVYDTNISGLSLNIGLKFGVL